LGQRGCGWSGDLHGHDHVQLAQGFLTLLKG
jgi:hypothetical protein